MCLAISEAGKKKISLSTLLFLIEKALGIPSGVGDIL